MIENVFKNTKLYFIVIYEDRLEYVVPFTTPCSRAMIRPVVTVGPGCLSVLAINTEGQLIKERTIRPYRQTTDSHAVQLEILRAD